MGNGRTHALRLGEELAPVRAREYLSTGCGGASYPALDREWLETDDGRWIKRSAIIELAVVSPVDAQAQAREQHA